MDTRNNVDELETLGGNAPGGDSLERKSDVVGALDAIRGRLETIESRMSTSTQGTPVPAEADELRSRVDSIEQALDDMPGDWRSSIDAINERLDAIDARAEMPEGTETRAVGEIIAASDAYKSLFAEGQLTRSQGFGREIQIPSLIDPREQRSVVGISDVGPATPPSYRPGIVATPYEPQLLMQRIPYIPIPGIKTYTVRKEPEVSRGAAVATTLASAVDGDPTPTNTATFTDVTGFAEGYYCRFWDASNNLLKRVKIVSINTSTNVVTFATGALDFDSASGNRVTSEVFAATAESGTKPSGYLTVTSEDMALQTLAVMLGVSEQVLDSVDGMTQWIETRLRMRARRNFSPHLLYGQGSSKNQLAGFANRQHLLTREKMRNFRSLV